MISKIETIFANYIAFSSTIYIIYYHAKQAYDHEEISSTKTQLHRMEMMNSQKSTEFLKVSRKLGKENIFKKPNLTIKKKRKM